jgi:small subunit ribosomal protein S16
MVVTEHTSGPKSNTFVERVGSYHPKTKATDIKADRVKYWISVGAKATGTVHNMLVTKGIVSGKKINVLPRKTQPKKEEAAAATPVAA